MPPDGKHVVTAGPDVPVQDVERGLYSGACRGHAATVIAVSADGKRCFSGASDGSVELRDLERDRVVPTTVLPMPGGPTKTPYRARGVRTPPLPGWE
jgi:hypothetical protein